MNTVPQGGVFAAYLILSGVARFMVEFIRINPRIFLGFTNAQIASAIPVTVGLGLWLYARRQNP